MADTLISAADLNAVIDELVRFMQRAKGNASPSWGLGVTGDTHGAAGAAKALRDYLPSLDPDANGALAAAIMSLYNNVSYSAYVKGRLSGVLNALEAHCRRAGKDDLKDAISDYNPVSGSLDAALQDYNFYELFSAWKPGQVIDPWNLYKEVLAADFTNAIGKFVASGAGAGTYTDGEEIDHTKYGRGSPKLLVSGLAGTGNVTITGLGYSPATRAVTASVTWVTAISADGLTLVVPGGGTAPADCCIVDSTNITIAAGITAGTFFLENHRPASRPKLPNG